MLKIAVLVSGGGTNLQAIIDGAEAGDIKGRVTHVISDREGAYALQRGDKHGAKTLCVSRKEHSSKEISDIILKELEGEVDLIVLGGFLTILSGNIIDRFERKIINIHPSLIPRHCGRGMYGDKVHMSVLKMGDKESGCTVHFVDSGTDTGPIIGRRIVNIDKEETLETLRDKVRKQEHELLVEVVSKMSNGGIL